MSSFKTYFDLLLLRYSRASIDIVFAGELQLASTLWFESGESGENNWFADPNKFSLLGDCI